MNRFSTYLVLLMLGSGILYSSIDTSFANVMSIWFRNSGYTYQEEEEGTEYWKTPEETIRDRGGDCEDFAFLVKEILSRVEGYSDIKVLALNPIEEGTTGHSICVFKESTGYLGYFDNYVYFKTNYKDLKKLLKNKYGYGYGYVFEIHLDKESEYLFNLEK